MISITFDAIASKLQDELADVILFEKQVNDYELIVYKYVFISELAIPVVEELGIEIAEESFILYVIPDDLEFSLLRKLDDAFGRFRIIFMPNEYGVLKLKFQYVDDLNV